MKWVPSLRKRALYSSREVGHEEARAAAVRVVAHRDPHAALLGAVLAHRDPRGEAHVLEGAVLLVLVEVVRLGVVRDVEVRPAVAVVVEPGDPETVVLVGVAHARLRAHLREAPVPLVAEQEVRLPGEPPRPALHRDAPVLARRTPSLALARALAELGQVVEVDEHVPADEEVEAAVPVVVGEAAAHGPAAPRDARGLGDLLERAVAVVAVEVVAPEAGDVDVRGPVAVRVTGADPHRPAGVPDARLVRHVLEPEAAEVAVEHAAHGLRVVPGVDGERVREVDVDEAVAVVVEERHPAAHRLHYVLLLGRGLVLEDDARLARDVAEEERRGRLGEGEPDGAEEGAAEGGEGGSHRFIPPEIPVFACTCFRRMSISPTRWR